MTMKTIEEQMNLRLLDKRWLRFVVKRSPHCCIVVGGENMRFLEKLARISPILDVGYISRSTAQRAGIRKVSRGDILRFANGKLAAHYRWRSASSNGAIQAVSLIDFVFNDGQWLARAQRAFHSRVLSSVKIAMLDARASGAAEPRKECPFATLGLREGATRDEIKRAHRSLLQACHPDRLSRLSPKFRSAGEDEVKRLNAARDAAIAQSSIS